MMKLSKSLRDIRAGNKVTLGKVNATFKGYVLDTPSVILGSGFAFVEEEFDLQSPKLLFFALLSLESAA